MSSKKRRHNNIRITLLSTVLIALTCLSLTSVVMADSKKEQTYRYYTSVQINSGDTLWSIANEYCSGSNSEIADYVKEIKQLNRLTSDNITSGQYITVIYYSTEYK